MDAKIYQKKINHGLPRGFSRVIDFSRAWMGYPNCQTL
jgi:hypothetical protein